MEASIPGAWKHYDIHGLVGMRVRNSTRSADQLAEVFDCFATGSPVADDIVVTGELEPLHEAVCRDGDLRFAADSVELVRDRVQIRRVGSGFHVSGPGQLLDAVTVVLDVLTAARGAAMVRGVSVAYEGAGIAIPSAGGTWQSGAVVRLMKHAGFSFVGDDWAFVDKHSQQLGFARPLSIQPHHRPIYPHLFEDATKSGLTSAISGQVERLSAAAQPYLARQHRIGDLARRWSPDRRLVAAAHALPEVSITKDAPLTLALFVERYEGARTRLSSCPSTSMVDRVIANFQFDLAPAARRVVDAMSVASLASRQLVDANRAAILQQAFSTPSCYVLQVPSVLTDDEAADDVIFHIEQLIRQLDLGCKPQLIDLTQLDNSAKAVF